MNRIHNKDEIIHLPLSKIINNILEESRMVLPGIQALFGFQLVAVFSEVFQSRLTCGEQVLHYISAFLIALATGLVLTTAAYHRKAEPESVSERFVILSTNILRLTMIPLMLGICLDFYLIGLLTLHDATASMVLSTLLLMIFIFLWYIFPNNVRAQSIIVD